ncbi:MAG: hypothetical protein ABSF12_00120 [Bryobacteraceae bacterium]|jgi:hypothetical protein
MAETAQALVIPIPSQHTAGRWSLLNRVLFRFAFVYLICYCWPGTGRTNLLDAIPNFGIGALNENGSLRLTSLLEVPWRALCPWVAVRIFHLQGAVTKYHPTGSGDTTLDYILVFCFATIAVFATLIWSVLDRRRSNYRTLYAWLRLLVRFTLAFTLLAYGFAKVYPLQFSPPFLWKLTETYGESSPMGILWTFMGASVAYTKFCGLAEVLGGGLLLFRRTATVGALVAMADMSNVVMLNFAYDVPVKLYSSNLLLMSLFLLIPDVSALTRFFFLDEPSRLQGVWVPKFERRHLRTAAITLQAVVICSVLYNNIWGGYTYLKSNSRKNAPLYGIWNADSFTGPIGWRQLTIHIPRFLVVRDAGGERVNFSSTYDESKHTLKLSSPQSKQEGEFTYSQPDPQHLTLRGNLNGNPVVADFHRFDDSRLLLTSRGFHWINEDPFNR